jgi:hypothetical protein
MQIVLRCALPLFALWLGASIARADPQYVPDPGKYAADIMPLLAEKNVASASKMISDTIGKPSYADNLQNAMNALSSKNIDYSDKVIDNTFGKSLRHIVYYSFVENVGFIYSGSISKCRVAAGYWPILFLKQKRTSYFRKTSSIIRFARVQVCVDQITAAGISKGTG